MLVRSRGVDEGLTFVSLKPTLTFSHLHKTHEMKQQFVGNNIKAYYSYFSSTKRTSMQWLTIGITTIIDRLNGQYLRIHMQESNLCPKLHEDNPLAMSWADRVVALHNFMHNQLTMKDQLQWLASSKSFRNCNHFR